MTAEEFMRSSFVSIEVNEAFNETRVRLRDRSVLRFCHRVDERWARAEFEEGADRGSSLAEDALARISMFRLNAKHLDVRFADGTRWEVRFKG